MLYLLPKSQRHPLFCVNCLLPQQGIPQSIQCSSYFQNLKDTSFFGWIVSSSAGNTSVYSMPSLLPKYQRHPLFCVDCLLPQQGIPVYSMLSLLPKSEGHPLLVGAGIVFLFSWEYWSAHSKFNRFSEQVSHSMQWSGQR